MQDLKTFHDDDGGFFGDKELYLLWNMSKGKGVGSFGAGDFHPDSILWVLADHRQYITFVAPKGVRSVAWGDPKIQSHSTIKDIEQRLGGPSAVHNSLITSNTPSRVMRAHWQVDKTTMETRRILFQEEDRGAYIRSMLESTVTGEP